MESFRVDIRLVLIMLHTFASLVSAVQLSSRSHQHTPAESHRPHSFISPRSPAVVLYGRRESSTLCTCVRVLLYASNALATPPLTSTTTHTDSIALLYIYIYISTVQYFYPSIVSYSCEEPRRRVLRAPEPSRLAAISCSALSSSRTSAVDVSSLVRLTCRVVSLIKLNSTPFPYSCYIYSIPESVLQCARGNDKLCIRLIK